MNKYYFSLLKKLTLREIKARYKQSFLGFFWVILSPFIQMIIMSFVFSNIVRFDSVGVPYPIFIYIGLLPWFFFNFSIGSSMGSLLENASLLKKIYFPREILVLSTIFAKLFDFMLSVVVLVLLMIFYKIDFSLYMLLFFPILFIQIIFTFSLGLLLSALNLFYRDVQYMINLVLTLWFYLTPVIYATEFFPEEYRWIFKINPLSVFINAYRQVLLNADFPNWGSLGIAVLISSLLFIFAYKIFKKLEKSFADVV
jgi:ABC-type polysaccharide/polyol phosphate export permease